ncbi:MAG: NmrA family NAD(P)-binding protein [Alphaproteobacteria bacterium]|nr:NmrA family NAD(P)-binding protein [Alphaproteobacteria bacterium]
MDERLIAVIGATGATGKHLPPRLAARGLNIRYLTRDAGAARATIGPDAEIVEASLDDRASLERAFADAHTLYLNSGHSPALEAQQTNAIEAAKAAGIERIVKLSGNIDSPAPIPEAHKALEGKIRASGLRHTFLRPNFFMSNLYYVAAGLTQSDSFTSAIPRDVKISMTDPRDVADLAAVVIAEDSGHDGEGYYQTGKALSLDEVASIFSDVLGRAIRYEQVDVETWEEMVTGRGLPPWLIEHQVKMIGFAANGAYAYETNATEDIVGHPKRTLEEFIRDHADAFAKTG